MRSSSGEYFEKLDHLRALAAFLVFSWHFTHVVGVPFDHTPAFPPLSILEEGHTGVSLFMVLSGYLFARLLDGKRIIFHRFLWNRVIRLLPLLTVALGLTAISWVAQGVALQAILYRLAAGAVLPLWPNGTWSIAVEFHFYLLLPLLLFAIRRRRECALVFILAALVVRTTIWATTGDVQSEAMWTILGRLDQFILGIYAHHLFRASKIPLSITVTATIAFSGFYFWFNVTGGFNGTGGDSIWIYLPTVEGAFYALMIAAYDHTRWTLRQRRLARMPEHSLMPITQPSPGRVDRGSPAH